jgi:hypothetical protein
MLTGVCVFCVAGRGANIEHLFRYTGLAVGLMKIENLIRYTELAMGLMEIENLIRYTELAVGLKPLAMECEARLREL